jgi:diguanylate cyclase (GGDEF)-like protein
MVIAALNVAIGLAAGVMVASPQRGAFFNLWSFTCVALVLAAITFDRRSSPVAVLLVLPIMFAGLAYPHRDVLAIGAMSVVGFAAVSAARFPGDGEHDALFALSLGLVTALAVKGAWQRERTRAEILALTRRLQDEATHDTLTGCLNRRGLAPLAEFAVARARRGGSSLSLMMIDVDRLKEVNDGFGHDAGDEALVAVAEVLHRGVRATDAVARMGGDEFAVLLADAAARDAATVGERLQAALAAHPLSGLRFDALGLPAPVPGAALTPVAVEVGGRPRWLRVSSRPLGVSGEEDATLIIISDESDLIALQQRVSEGERLEAVGRVASGVAHDFNNVLSTVRGRADLLLESVAGDSPAAQDAAAIIRATDRAASLVQQLLAFAHRQELRPSLVDLNDIIVDALAFCEALLPQSITVAFQRGQAVPVVADAGRLHGVVTNLLLNARDAINGAGDITVASYVEGGDAVLTVTDDGSGMTSEQVRQCFEPFFTTKPGGTGLGLATVHGIIARSGGTILLSSEPGRGSRFEVRLPAAAV